MNASTPHNGNGPSVEGRGSKVETAECPIPPDGVTDEQVRAEWRAVCTVLQTVRIHEAGEVWHRESMQEELLRAARRWHLPAENGPFVIRQALEDLLVKLSLRLAQQMADAAVPAAQTA